MNMRGFVVIELLVVIAIIVILGALALPLYTSFIATTQFDNATRDIAEALRRAQAKAWGSYANNQWGVHFENDRFVVFQGTSWALRNSAFDEPQTTPSTVTMSSSPLDIIFKKNGSANSDGTVTINESGGKTKNIIISSEGVIDAL